MKINSLLCISITKEFESISRSLDNNVNDHTRNQRVKKYQYSPKKKYRNYFYAPRQHEQY